VVISLPSGEAQIGTLTIERQNVLTNRAYQPKQSIMKLDFRYKHIDTRFEDRQSPGPPQDRPATAQELSLVLVFANTGKNFSTDMDLWKGSDMCKSYV
jgi:hypothetical protein